MNNNKNLPALLCIAAMLAEGIYFAPSAFEAGFVSAAHGTDEIEQTLAAR